MKTSDIEIVPCTEIYRPTPIHFLTDDISDFTYQLIHMQKQSELTSDESAVLAQFTDAHFRQLLTDLFFGTLNNYKIIVSRVSFDIIANTDQYCYMSIRK